MAKGNEDETGEYGRWFAGKPDLNRIGFFDDTPPGPWDEYSGGNIDLNLLRSGLRKGPQITSKETGGLFEKEIRRIFEGEALEGLGLRKKKKGKNKIKHLGILMPPSAPKKHSTPGDWFGCIGWQPKHFSSKTKSVEPKTGPKPPNILIKPNPRGGPGYLNICLNPYQPVYIGYEPYDPDYVELPKDEKRRRRFFTRFLPRPYFDENPYRSIPLPSPESPLDRHLQQLPVKRFNLTFPRAPKGPNSGCFHKFPRYWPDPYDKSAGKSKRKVHKAPFRPTGGPPFRTKFTTSIIDKVTRVACNINNFTEYREQVYPAR